jgi:predicted  nucleic acid-binding Zn-ribbon protein
MTDKKPTIEFAPGCFDNFEGTQEELDALMIEIQTAFENGEMEEQSMELTDEAFEELPDEIKDKLLDVLMSEDDEIEITRKLQ